MSAANLLAYGAFAGALLAAAGYAWLTRRVDREQRTIALWEASFWFVFGVLIYWGSDAIPRGWHPAAAVMAIVNLTIAGPVIPKLLRWPLRQHFAGARVLVLDGFHRVLFRGLALGVLLVCGLVLALLPADVPTWISVCTCVAAALLAWDLTAIAGAVEVRQRGLWYSGVFYPWETMRSCSIRRFNQDRLLTIVSERSAGRSPFSVSRIELPLSLTDEQYAIFQNAAQHTPTMVCVLEKAG